VTVARALMSRSLARRLAWIAGARVRCRIEAARLRLHHGKYSEQLSRLRAHGAPSEQPFAGVDDDFWYWLIRQSYFRPKEFEGVLPGFPDEAVQMRFTGARGELMLWHAFSAYRLFRSLAAEHGRPVSSCQAVLDFGCGWGRIIRFFMKDIAASRLVGVDVNPEMIDMCRRHNRWSRFEVVAPSGPTGFPDGSFDLVLSFSVFSHFSEPMHLRWLQEVRRILKAGGLFIATTRPRDFIEQSVLDRIRRPLSQHPDAIAGMFGDTQRWLAAYDAGRYCYEPLPNMVDWGEACIPKAYVEREWAKYFTVLDYIDDPRRCPQNVIVARR
jgi:SAM-dependent methyltransferase